MVCQGSSCQSSCSGVRQVWRALLPNSATHHAGTQLCIPADQQPSQHSLWYALLALNACNTLVGMHVLSVVCIIRHHHGLLQLCIAWACSMASFNSVTIHMHTCMHTLRIWSPGCLGHGEGAPQSCHVNYAWYWVHARRKLPGKPRILYVSFAALGLLMVLTWCRSVCVTAPHDLHF